MPFFMHQWSYHDKQVRKIVTDIQDREEVVRVATDAFGGKLHHFFFAMGEHDGVAISEFPDAETALACLMTIFAQGSILSLKTTPLFQRDEGQRAIRRAHDILEGGGSGQ